MDFDRFIPEGAVFFRPASLPKDTTRPVPARFVSAHFIFTLGDFCVEVPHDPDLYFHGEEINLAVRAFTHGYDLFHPHEIICWHEYSREGRQKHWDDHGEWHQQNNDSHARNRHLLGMAETSDGTTPPDFGPFGFGKRRELRDYERYAGVHFGLRSVHEHTLQHLPLPVPGADLPETEWEKAFCVEFDHTIKFAPPPELDCPGIDFWCLAYDDEQGRQIYRRDLMGDQLQSTLHQWREDSGATFIQIPNRFFAPRGRPPKKWVVWPHHGTDGWRERFEGPILQT